MANANWFYYLDPDPFWGTTPIEKPEDCDCDKPGTLTDTLIGSLESFFGKEAQDDEIIGAESLPRTPQGWGVFWRPEWSPNGRRRNFIDANLSWAELTGVDLREANLKGADLRRAHVMNGDFRDAVLTDANLSNADLWQADLRLADLKSADLWEVDLSRADLRRADLTDAEVRVTDLRWADLRWADLRGADLSRSDLRWADLRGALNLDQTINPDWAFWFRTTCPDGSMNIGNSPCFGDQLIPF